MKTVFRNVPVNTKVYRSVMCLVGECLKAGGYVDYEHRQVIKSDEYGNVTNTNTIDVVLVNT